MTSSSPCDRGRRRPSDDRLGAVGHERGPDRPAGVEGPVDRLHALDEELAALLALAPVVAERLEELELGVLAGDRGRTGQLGERRAAAAGPRGGLAQPLAERGVGDGGQRLAPLVHGLALELGGAVLGDDHVDLVARRGDDRAGLEPRDDPRAQLVADRDRRRAGTAASGPRASRAGPDTKSSWPPMPEYCTPSIVSAITWPWMSTAMAALIVTMRPVAADGLGRVHEVDGQERDLVVARASQS